MFEIIINPDQLIAFLGALLHKLAGPEARVAFWFYQPLTLPVSSEPLNGPSPFPGSGCTLAGHGYLASLTSTDAEVLAAFFAKDFQASSALVHMEAECAGLLQFRSYDNFEIIIPGPALDNLWLNDLAQRGLIEVA